MGHVECLGPTPDAQRPRAAKSRGTENGGGGPAKRDGGSGSAESGAEGGKCEQDAERAGSSIN